MGVPTDPRTPQQRVADQLAAAHRQLVTPGLNRADRARCADRIHELREEATRLGT